MKSPFSILFISIILISCSDKTEELSGPGTLTLHFDNVVGEKDLMLATTSYVNGSNETFTITALRYFISNISIKKTDGTTYTIPKDSSYFLIDESVEESQDIILKNIPEGDYNEVTFTIGVDSLKSVSDDSQRNGVLVPTTETYWSLNEGYIFFSLEGISSASPDSKLSYHIGGFGGLDAKTINNLQTITISAGSNKAEVRSNIEPEIHLYLDILKIFNGDPIVSIADHPQVGLIDYSLIISKKYAEMIQFGHIHNDPKGD